jgi:hypothetical protein
VRLAVAARREQEFRHAGDGPPLKVPSANFNKPPVGRKERPELLCLRVQKCAVLRLGRQSEMVYEIGRKVLNST